MATSPIASSPDGVRIAGAQRHKQPISLSFAIQSLAFAEGRMDRPHSRSTYQCPLGLAGRSHTSLVHAGLFSSSALDFWTKRARLRVGGLRRFLRILLAKTPQDLFHRRLFFHDEPDHGAKFLKIPLPQTDHLLELAQIPIDQE
jgi:hypothetical protein